MLVGCGAMSKAWLEAARQIDGLTIVGLVDLDRSRAHARAESSASTARRSARSSTRCSTRAARRGVRRRRAGGATRSRSSAFAYGCHLLTEKPLADSRDNARAIVAAARKAGRIHAVVQNRRYSPASAASGASSNRARSARRPASTATSSSRRISAASARRCDHVLLLDMAIHTFDAARYMASGEPRSGLLPRMGAAELLVPAGLLGRPPSSR